PALTVAVILDSAEGLHQGGQVCAPVWRRIMQQALEYMHVPHDVEIKNDARRQMLLASAKDDIDEASDHLGAPLVLGDDADSGTTVPQANPAATPPPSAKILDPWVHPAPTAEAAPQTPEPPISENVVPAGDTPTGKGTVVIDVNGGPVVPSFVGKTMRGAV